MRPFALLAMMLTLAGCGGDFSTWYDPPFSTGSNPHLPQGDSENMRRVMGQQANVEPLTTEPGDVWPGPVKPPPTLQDLENQNGQPQIEPTPPVGSSSPPTKPAPLSRPQMPAPAPGTLPPATSAAPHIGQTVQTSHGQGVTTGGTAGYQTIETPGGGQSIVVPNGNGTSTIIHPNGAVETVPTPK